MKKNMEGTGLGEGLEGMERGVKPGEWDWQEKYRRRRLPKEKQDTMIAESLEMLAEYCGVVKDRFWYGILLNEYLRVKYPDKAAGEDSAVPYDLLTPIRDAMSNGKETEKLYRILDDWYEEVKAECERDPEQIRRFSLGFGFLLERDMEIKKGVGE